MASTDDLLFPVGLLDPALLWPGVSSATVSEYLDAFLAAGTAKVATWEAGQQDAGAIAWAEYRALDSVLRRVVNEPLTVAFADEGSAGYTSDQLRYMREDRDAALAEFEALEVAATADDPYAFTTIRSFRD